jgi:hypothetical protein
VGSTSVGTAPGLRDAFGNDKYIVSPGFDWLFFIGSPVLAIAAVHAALQVFPAASIQSSVLTYMALGHHVPTFLRAYGDADEFRRNRFRLIAIPLCILPAVWLMYLLDSRLLAMIFLWDQYHFVRQQYGFMRIYDAKVGNIPTSANNLDQWLCFSWFIAILAFSDFYAFGYTHSFFEFGLTLPDWTGVMLRRGSLAVAGVVSILYLGNLLRSLAYGEPIALLKLCITLTTYGSWAYAYAVLSDPLTSYTISALFHCLQYDALAWVYSRKKAVANEGGGFFRAVHAPGRLWLYVTAILAYPVFSQLVGVVSPAAIYVVNLATGAVHYYFDSFIWRVRRTQFREHL